MGLAITSVVDVGADVLAVIATDDDDNTYSATGWVSATTNHYDPSSYDADGNLVEGAQPRAMTPDEIGAYALAQVLAQNPELAVRAAAAEATPVAFTPPAPLELAPVADESSS